MEVSNLKKISINKNNGTYEDGTRYEGREAFRFQQACVDMHIAVKIMQLIAINKVKHICILAGDGDFYRPLKAYKSGGSSYERISVLGFRESTSLTLWGIANDIIELDKKWIGAVEFVLKPALPATIVLKLVPAPISDPVVHI